MRNEVIITTKLETKDFDREIKHLENELEGLEEDYEILKKQKPFEGQEEALRKLSDKILQAKKRLNLLVIEKEKLEKTDLIKFESSINNVGKSVQSIIGKMGKWALAIFSVRSAYSLIRQSVSTLSQYNEKMAADIENIRYAVASTMQPVVEKIIQAVYKLLQYINYIANAWFGKNIFENANKNLKSANKSANQLKKTLAGFDKLNILSNNKTTGGIVSPSVDLSKQLGKGDVPWWVDWISKNKDLFKDITTDLLLLFGAATVAKILANISMLFGSSGGMGLIGLKEILAIIGTTYLVKIAIDGVIEARTELEKLNRQLEDNTKQAETNKIRQEEIIETYKELLKENKLTDEQLKLYTGSLKGNTERGLENIKMLEESENWVMKLVGADKKLIEQQEIEKENVLNLLQAFSYLYEQNKLDAEGTETYKQLLEKTTDVLAEQGIEVENLKKDYEKLTGKNYEITLKAKADTKQANKDFSNLFTRIGDSLGQIFVLSNPLGAITNLGNKIASIWNGKKYAKGGIINMPGRGIPIGGERGYEGIVPLTDTAQMELLGASIGKHVVINNDITLELESRVLARVMQEINNDNRFARNGG